MIFFRQSFQEKEETIWFFADVDDSWQSEQTQRLAALLPDSEAVTTWPLDDSQMIWVVPRIGTISPWSSKATDIIQNCGFEGLQRIERGRRLPLEKKAYDPLTESILTKNTELIALFETHEPQPLSQIDLLGKGFAALEEADQRLGLSLNQAEMNYLLDAFKRLQRNPTDVELMMFSQVNSEHCRHKIFNAHWTIDDQAQTQSLFDMIRHTYRENPDQAIVAYSDNAAVLRGSVAQRWMINHQTHQYEATEELSHIVLKVETHNHPTAISPFPGAATGSGGEIRDEAATGRGACPKAGWSGFSVSHLRIPNFIQPWECDVEASSNMASPLDIMLQAPIGAAAFNNEFGRPCLAGYFRAFFMTVNTEYGVSYRGYHKPIMIAGGVGVIRESQTHKKQLPIGALLIVLGGPAMAIGLGGGSASSRVCGDDTDHLDFASVQRANPEMQRRCQEVINVCWSLGEDNPILSIHDVGAGGLSNALPELVAASEAGARIQLRDIPNAAPGMTPLEIWCNEAQERYVLAISPEHISLFTDISKRERCLFAVVGEVTRKKDLILEDSHFNNQPVAMPTSVLFDEMPRSKRRAKHFKLFIPSAKKQDITLEDAVQRVLQLPCVSSKRFLITIGDRSVTGLVARDPMVGPWQVPVADVAVTSADYQGVTGEAMAIGERAPIALVHHAASARMAVGEALTNIAAAHVEHLSHIALSANWMAAPDYKGEGAGLFDAVQAIGLELCPALGISIPVGKDSLSMRNKEVVSPLSLVITAAAPVCDVRATLTPQLRLDQGPSHLVLIDLGEGCHCMGGSALEQVYGSLSQRPPDLDDSDLFNHFFQAIQSLHEKKLMLAYHDRSDGGLLTTLCEMMFAGRVGIDVVLDDLVNDNMDRDLISALFTEELGVILQIKKQDLFSVMDVLHAHQLTHCIHVLGTLNDCDELRIECQDQWVYRKSRVQLQRWWEETSYRMQALRDNPECAQQEYDALLKSDDPGLQVKLTFEPQDNITAPFISVLKKPRVAILREQGINGHMETAAAFAAAGFDCFDVHMTDILSQAVNLDDFVGLAIGGGFSYGDVLGAGRGWSQLILNQPIAQAAFSRFFQREDTFTFGACNGCQLLADLKSFIPGAETWPIFKKNRSRQFEGRVSLVRIESSPSIFLTDMVGSILPVSVSHGEGRAEFATQDDYQQAEKDQLITLRYVDHYQQVTEQYPDNPNGSPAGITGLTTPDGRVLMLMPHPERVYRTQQNSWHPDDWGSDGPWLRLFRNARLWVQSH